MAFSVSPVVRAMSRTLLPSAATWLSAGALRWLVDAGLRSSLPALAARRTR